MSTIATTELVCKEPDTPYECEWSIRRDGGYDMTDEWIPSLSYTCSKYLSPIIRRPELMHKYGSYFSPHYYSPFLVCTILGKGRKGSRSSIRVTNYFCKLRVGDFEWTSHWEPELEGKKTFWHGKCNSVKNALSKVDSIPDIKFWVDKLIAKMYSKESHECWYILDENKQNPKPFCSRFRTQPSNWDMPVGEYVYRNRYHKFTSSFSFNGYSSGGVCGYDGPVPEPWGFEDNTGR